MLQLKKGDYFGAKQSVLDYRDIVITNTKTSLKEVPWHYHENAHFSYFIKGNVQEVNKKDSFSCSQGTLIYHHSAEPHYNNKGGLVNNLHIEVIDNWFIKYDLKDDHLHGTTILKHPSLVSIFSQLHKEIIINDKESQLTIEGLLLQAFGIMLRNQIKSETVNPKWVSKIREYLYENNSQLNLLNISNELNLHPTYLSKAFPKYFHCSFGEYIRKLRLQKAALLLKDKRHSLTNIAYECEFSDQSHFIRCFKQTYQMTPLQYRKSILDVN